MSMNQIVETVRTFDGILELAPRPESEFPEIAWGDHFFYYAPDRQVPRNYQPFATIVTKDYPGEPSSNLDPDGRYRVNIDVGRAEFTELIGETPREFNSLESGSYDFSAADVFLPHPAYGARGWIAVVNPSHGTMPTLNELLRAAYERQRRQVTRRAQERDRNDESRAI